MGSKCIVTGGAGFIGSHLVDALLARGRQVVVIDNLSSGKIENLRDQSNNPDLLFHKESITNEGALRQIFKEHKPTEVFHLAAIPRVQFSLDHPLETHNANTTGTLNVFMAALEYGARRVIYSSSSSVYGDQETTPLRESMSPRPKSFYAAQKLYGEQMASIFWLSRGLPTISLRYFNVFGPRQDSDSTYSCLIPKAIANLSRGLELTVYGDGNQTRDFTYIKDVVDANILAGEIDSKKVFGLALNIGAGRNLSVNYVINEVRKLVGESGKIAYTEGRLEPRDTLADNSLAQKYLGWVPTTPFKEALEITYNAAKNCQDKLL